MLRSKRKFASLLLDACRESFTLANQPERILHARTKEGEKIVIEEPGVFRITCVVELADYPVFESDIMEITFSYLSWAQRILFVQKHPECKRWISEEFLHRSIGKYQYHDASPLWSHSMASFDISAEQEYYVGEALDSEVLLLKNMVMRTKYEQLRWARQGNMAALQKHRSVEMWSKTIWEELVRGLFEREETVQLVNLVSSYRQEVRRTKALASPLFWWIQETTLCPQRLLCLQSILYFLDSYNSAEACEALQRATHDIAVCRQIEKIFQQKALWPLT